jgi:hypothetical protein
MPESEVDSFRVSAIIGCLFWRYAPEKTPDDAKAPDDAESPRTTRPRHA